MIRLISFQEQKYNWAETDDNLVFSIHWIVQIALNYIKKSTYLGKVKKIYESEVDSPKDKCCNNALHCLQMTRIQGDLEGGGKKNLRWPFSVYESEATFPKI